MTYADTQSAWHDFYLTAGAASATLVGLLFVGISLHVRTVATHIDVRGLARVTLSTFFTVVVISLVMLMPSDRPGLTGLALLATAIVSVLLVLPAVTDAIRTDRRRTLPRRVVLSRFGLVLMTELGLATTGALLANGDHADGLGGLVGVVFLMLVVSVRNSWDLLVTLATA